MNLIKNIMVTINLILSLTSCAILGSLLIFGYFGWAWISTIPLAYFILSTIVIESSREEEI